MAAYTFPGFTGSIARSATEPPQGPLVVHFHWPPSSVAAGVAVSEGNSVKVEIGEIRAAVVFDDKPDSPAVTAEETESVGILIEDMQEIPAA